MAYCPKCRSPLAPSELVCPNCGYDFPGLPRASDPAREGAESSRFKDRFEYSRLADIALVISAIAAAVGCVVVVLLGIVSLIKGELLMALVYCPLAFFTELGI